MPAETLLSKCKRALQPLSLALVLDIFRAELQHLLPERVQLHLFAPALLLRNRSHSEGFAKPALSVYPLRK